MNIIKRNNVTVRGQGKQTIIFANGYGCNQNMWRFLTPVFEKDYQVICFDHVGGNLSDSSYYDRTRYSSLQGYADDLLEICEALDCKDVVFVGHSVGTMIGALAAIKQPNKFSSLILLGPSPCYINDASYKGGFDAGTIQGLLNSLEDNFHDWAHAIAPVIMGNLERPELGEELAQSFCGAKPEIAKEFARVTFLSDVRPEVSQLKVKTLILQCAQDAIAPETVGRFLHEQIKNSTLILMQATGHCPHLSSPDETIKEIQSFLKASSAKAA